MIGIMIIIVFIVVLAVVLMSFTNETFKCSECGRTLDNGSNTCWYCDAQVKEEDIKYNPLGNKIIDHKLRRR